MKKLSLFIVLLLMAGQLLAQKKDVRVLMVLSSHEQLGNTGKKTGYYLSEVTHAYEVLFTEAGYTIDMVSPQGGKAPVDGFDLNDPVNKKLWENKKFQKQVSNTLRPDQVEPAKYDVIYYAGGHGTMWDFADNAQLAAIASSIYERNGIVGAVCHGPSGLVNIRLSNGAYLVEGKRVSAFTNQEEDAVELTEVVPFSLEDKLLERGATIVKGNNWAETVSVDERLVTGQNPASATLVAKNIVKLLNK